MSRRVRVRRVVAYRECIPDRSDRSSPGIDSVMGWLALLAAALYYHPWTALTVIGVTILSIGATRNWRKQTR
jgi:hypothetical protein